MSEGLEARGSNRPSENGNIAKPESCASETAPATNVAKPLTPEEQMALFEKELKESDWGHQPC